MKKLLLGCSFVLALGLQSAWAIPARRGIVKELTQPDGSKLAVKVIGDERTHVYMTTDDLPLVADDKGYMCYADLDGDGKPVASRFIARDVTSRTSAERAFVSGINADKVGEAIFDESLTSSRYNTTSVSGIRRANQSTGIGLDEGDALFPHIGDPHAIVLLVEYSDVKFFTADAASYYEEFLNKEGFNRDGGWGSCRDYFIASSAGQFRPTFDLYGPVTLPHKQEYYGGNDATWAQNDLRPEQMVVDAVKILDPEVDFSKYDIDNDGRIDNIYIIYAGQGENSYGGPSTVWPHRWKLTSAGVSLTVDGKIVDDYGCCNEYDQYAPTGIGTFCHEFGHVMGLPDLYSTTYNNAQYLTPGDWSVMDHGSYNNDGRTPPSYSIFERNSMGWIDPIVLEKAAHITLRNIHDTNEGAIVLTNSKNEFFLFENRQQTGWDTFLPGHGMLAWHIDYRPSIWSSNQVNNTDVHQYVDIEEAGGYVDNGRADYMSAYPFPGTSQVTSFTDDTKPSMRNWAGHAQGKPITNITEQGGVIHFDVCGGEPIDAPVVRHSDVTSGGFTLSWTAVENARSYLVDVFTRDAAGNAVAAGRFKDFEVSGTTCIVDRLDGATQYAYTVRAAGNSNISEPSAEGTVTTGQPVFELAVPRVNDATDTEAGAFTANWQTVNDATDYLLTVMIVRNTDAATDLCEFGVGNSLRFNDGWSSSSKKYYGTISRTFCVVAPALQMAEHGDYLLSPIYPAEILSMQTWLRSASDYITNAIEISVRPDENSDWHRVLYRDNLEDTKGGEWISADNIPAGMHQLKLTYYKPDHAGNVAIDNLSVETGHIIEGVLDGYNAVSTGNATSMRVSGLPADAVSASYQIVARKADGTLSLVSDKAYVDLKANSGIGDIIASDDKALGISIADGIVTVSGRAGTDVIVADLSGRIIATAVIEADGTARIAVPTGFAIVRAGSHSDKIFVK
ncbi:MAG: M6 family metalloprotease domain-containing protein [Bacteroidales bacterium]|nr:M6 family metalloprotease domain-containing protein [Bacteroidales bacterium]